MGLRVKTTTKTIDDVLAAPEWQAWRDAEVASEQARLACDDAEVEAARVLEDWLVSMPAAERIITCETVLAGTTRGYLGVAITCIYTETLETMPYDDYLRTGHWQRTRREALERAGNACQACSATRRLQVHHRTYDRRGSELPEDLTVLCDDCHRTFHEHRGLVRN